MTRSIAIIAILALTLLVSAAPAAAGHGGTSTGRCSISVDRHFGGAYSAFRLRGEGWPAGTIKDLTIVEIHIRHVGTDSGSIAWLWLVPGGTWFIFDYNDAIDPGEPDPDPLDPGLYRVRAQAEGHRCVARDSFVVGNAPWPGR